MQLCLPYEFTKTRSNTLDDSPFSAPMLCASDNATDAATTAAPDTAESFEHLTLPLSFSGSNALFSAISLSGDLPAKVHQQRGPNPHH